MQAARHILDEMITRFEEKENNMNESMTECVEPLTAIYHKRLDLLIFGFTRQVFKTYGDIHNILVSLLKVMEIFEFNVVFSCNDIMVEIYLNHFVLKLIKRNTDINKYEFKYINKHFDGDESDIDSFVIEHDKLIRDTQYGLHTKIYPDMNYLTFGGDWNEDENYQYKDNKFRYLLFKAIAYNTNNKIIGETKWKRFHIKQDTFTDDIDSDEFEGDKINPNRRPCYQYFNDYFIKNKQKEYVDINEWMLAISKMNQFKSESNKFTQFDLKKYFYFILTCYHDIDVNYCCKGIHKSQFWTFVCCNGAMNEINNHSKLYQKFIQILRNQIPNLS